MIKPRQQQNEDEQCEEEETDQETLPSIREKMPKISLARTKIVTRNYERFLDRTSTAVKRLAKGPVLSVEEKHKISEDARARVFNVLNSPSKYRISPLYGPEDLQATSRSRSGAMSTSRSSESSSSDWKSSLRVNIDTTEQSCPDMATFANRRRKSSIGREMLSAVSPIVEEAPLDRPFFGSDLPALDLTEPNDLGDAMTKSSKRRPDEPLHPLSHGMITNSELNFLARERSRQDFFYACKLADVDSLDLFQDEELRSELYAGSALESVMSLLPAGNKEYADSCCKINRNASKNIRGDRWFDLPREAIPDETISEEHVTMDDVARQILHGDTSKKGEAAFVQTEPVNLMTFVIPKPYLVRGDKRTLDLKYFGSGKINARAFEMSLPQMKLLFLIRVAG